MKSFRKLNKALKALMRPIVFDKVIICGNINLDFIDARKLVVKNFSGWNYARKRDAKFFEVGSHVETLVLQNGFYFKDMMP